MKEDGVEVLPPRAAGCGTSRPTEHLAIQTSRAGAEAGVLGAAATAIEHVLSPEAVEAAAMALTGT